MTEATHGTNVSVDQVEVLAEVVLAEIALDDDLESIEQRLDQLVREGSKLKRKMSPKTSRKTALGTAKHESPRLTRLDLECRNRRWWVLSS